MSLKKHNFKLQTTKAKHELNVAVFSIETPDFLLFFYSSEFQFERRSELHFPTLNVKV